MKSGIKRLLAHTSLVFLVLSLLATGCGKTVSPTSSKPAENETQVYTVSSPASSEIKVTLSVSGSPWLGQPVEVVTTFALAEPFKIPAEKTTARIVLPPGFELVSGKLEWQGDVFPGIRYEIKATIKAVSYGDWRIEARVFSIPDEHTASGSTAYLWALVYPDHATISNRPTQPTGIPRGTPIPPPTEKPRGPKPGEGNITPGPAPIPPVLYPIETPSEKPSGGANITPTSLSPPSSSSLPSGGTTFTNPLVVTGGFTCNISENSLPQSPQQIVKGNLVVPFLFRTLL